MPARSERFEKINDRMHVRWPWDDRPIPPRRKMDSELLETVVQTRKRLLSGDVGGKTRRVYARELNGKEGSEFFRRIAFRGNGHAAYESYTRYLDGLTGNSRAGDGYDGDKIGEISVEMYRSGGAAKLNATFGVEATDAYEPLRNFRVYRLDELLLSLERSTFDLLPVNKRNDDAAVDYARNAIGKHIAEPPRNAGIEMAGTD